MSVRPVDRSAGPPARPAACSLPTVAAMAIACGCLVAAPPAASGQIAVPQVGPQIAIQLAAQQFFQNGNGEESEAIGDAWWDEAEAKRPAPRKAPEEEALEDEAGEQPADAQAMLQQQLRAQAEALAQQVRQQGLMILRRELSLVRQSCPSLEKQQRALVLEAGRGAIDRAVDAQMQAAGGGRRRPAKQTDLETTIRDALEATVKANAADDEFAAYEAEHRLREDRRKAAVVAAIVAEVDREAYLDAAEREALAKALAESYRARWRAAVTTLEQQGMLVPDENVLPGLERCVEKALGKERKARWVAARDEARTLAGAAGMQQMQFLRNGLQVQAWAAAPGMIQPAAVRRVIRRQVQADRGGVQVQVEVQVGAAAGLEVAPAEDETEDGK